MNRYVRQSDIIPRDKIEDCSVTVIGVGAVGRQAALQLTSMGVVSLQLIDFDTVEVENLSPQGYLEKDLGSMKVDATASICKEINPYAQIRTVPEKYKKSTDLGNVVFCCVDKISIRRFIWEHEKEKHDLFIDSRMAAEAVRIISVYDPVSEACYGKTLFSDREAYEEPCTAKATIFCSNIAAGLMMEQFARWLRGIPPDMDLQLNLFTSEISVK